MKIWNDNNTFFFGLIQKNNGGEMKSKNELKKRL